MIESNNPEINVDELMQKIREEVAKSQNGSFAPRINAGNASSIISNINYIQALINNAESRAIIRRKWPDKLNRFPFNLNAKLQELILKIINFLFKDQREVNLNLINSLKESVQINKQLAEEINKLQSQMDEYIGTVDGRVGEDKQLSIQALDERLESANINLQRMDESFSTKNIWINNSITAIEQRLDEVDCGIQKYDESLITFDNQLEQINESFSAIDILASNFIAAIEQRLSVIDNRIQKLEQDLGTVNTIIQSSDERYLKNDSYIKSDLVQQKRLITVFLELAQQRLSEPFNQKQLQTFVHEDQHLLDAFYVAFEDKFRGSREIIFDRLKFYLPLITETKIGTRESPILDVGCGRGEWLELLRESGYEARGLDINRVMLEECRYRGLEVIEGDVIAYLQSLPDASLGGVTGFHIIEHLPFATLIKLFDETIRVLIPGGLAIFETPNPENVLVGSHTFYIDPTHRNPLPNIMVKFIAESRGLSRVTITNLHPYPDEYRLTGSEIAEKFSNYFYGPQDYAVIGYKL